MNKNQKTISQLDFRSFTSFYGYLGILIGIITGILDTLSVKFGIVTLPAEVNIWWFFILHIITYVIFLYLGSLVFVLFYNWMAAKGKGIKINLE
ncbi:MAG: hypothetical protein Q7R96_03810 [Nanoarchaeota archaeon]|nr:hypothetical protein [Nanoarchaeota archaeon]